MIGPEVVAFWLAFLSLISAALYLAAGGRLPEDHDDGE